jgi:hypothetical protein
MKLYMVIYEDGAPGYSVEGIYSNLERATRVAALLRKTCYPQFYRIMEFSVDAPHPTEQGELPVNPLGKLLTT